MRGVPTQIAEIKLQHVHELPAAVKEAEPLFSL